MSKTVLIIDDQEAAAEAIAEVCRGMDLEVVIVTKPDEAKPAFERQPADLLIIDLFLPGTDGFAVGKQIRALPAGAVVPIIAVSGVLKQSTVPREVWAQLKGDFLPKPFDVKALSDLVAQRLGLVSQQEDQPRARVQKRVLPEARSFESDLGRDPVYRIFTRLYEQRASGHLDLTRGKARRRITFHQGRLRFATSNLKQENIGGMQVAQGTLEEAAFTAAMETARSQRVGIGEALVINRAMTRPQMESALSEQVKAVSIGSLGWADGQARFELNPEGAANVPDRAVHPFEIVVQGIARHYPPESIKTFLKGRRQSYVHRTELLDREKFILRKTSPGEQLTLAITGLTTLGELLDKARDQDLPLLFALVGSGLVRLHESPQTAEFEAPASAPPPKASPPTPRVAAPPPAARAAPQSSPSPAQATDADRSAGAEIDAEHRRVANANHFEVLGVSESASAETIQAAYRKAASKWHVDRFSGLALGDSKRRLEEAFARIGEAKDVLSDDASRKEYVVFLDRKAKGLPTDVTAILAAEGCCEDGEKLLRAGRADKALEKFEEAISLNSSEPEFYAWRGYARFRAEGAGALAKARADIQRALDADQNMAAPNYFLGMIAMSEENLEEATRMFKRVLVNNPQHPEAQQQLRVIKARSEKKGGLFGKLFKK